MEGSKRCVISRAAPWESSGDISDILYRLFSRVNNRRWTFVGTVSSSTPPLPLIADLRKRRESKLLDAGWALAAPSLLEWVLDECQRRQTAQLTPGKSGYR